MAFDFDTNQLLSQDRDFFASAQTELSGPNQQGELANVYVQLRQAHEVRRYADFTSDLVDRSAELNTRTQESTVELGRLAEAIARLMARWRNIPWRGIGDV